MQPLLGLAEAFLGLATLFLDWIVDTSLSGAWSLTNPAHNALIRTGWELTRDLANIGIVLGLVFIGLGTALRLTGFKTQKAFVSLLIIALFINFTPLICGLIVDASNILLKFFLPSGVSSHIGQIFLEKVMRAHMWGLAEMGGGAVPFASTVKFLVLTGVGFVGGFALLIFAALFLFRLVAIPILVILSPIAFFCYIFEQTIGFFEMWWKQLISWSLIGAVGAFFLYLTVHCSDAIERAPLLWKRIPPGSENLATFWGSVSSYFVVLAFLVIGLFVTLSTNAMGTESIIGFAKTQGKMGLKMGTAAALGYLSSASVGITKGATKGIKKGKGFGGKVLGGLTGGLKGFGRGGFTTEGREEARTVAEQSRAWGTRMLEEMHLMPVGTTASYRLEATKREKGRTKALADAGNHDQLHAIVQRNPDTGYARGALSHLLDKGKLTKAEIPEVAQVINKGFLSAKPFLEQYPHAAEQVGKTIFDAIENRTANDLAKKVTNESLGDKNVILEIVKQLPNKKDFGRFVNALNNEKRKIVFDTASYQIDLADRGYLNKTQYDNFSHLITDLTLNRPFEESPPYYPSPPPEV